MTQDTDKLREAYTELLSSMNTKYHLTITFPMHTSLRNCEALLNRLVLNLNRAIYKKRYDKGKSFIQGVAVREHTFAMNTDHYHILLVDDGYLPDYERMNTLIEKQLRLLGNDSLHTKKKNYITRYRLQNYFNNGDDRLEGYVTKQFEGSVGGLRKTDGAVGLLGGGSVMFSD